MPDVGSYLNSLSNDVVASSMLLGSDMQPSKMGSHAGKGMPSARDRSASMRYIRPAVVDHVAAA